jgi:hypothetical protein
MNDTIRERDRKAAPVGLGAHAVVVRRRVIVRVRVLSHPRSI